MSNSHNQKIEDIFAGLEVSETTDQGGYESKAENLPQAASEKTSETSREAQGEAIKAAAEAETASRELATPGQSVAVEKTSPVLAPAKQPAFYPKVEQILEEDLREVYLKMGPEKQKEFKIKGEAVTFKISQLLQNTKVKVRQIFKLIIGWLSLIPGVNKHFLEQEAKIKTDKLLAARDEELRK